ncbi:unnamed protein product [Rhizoctonia solani]|nr:unnamed protein product [Rhizoctonia solani]
MPRLSTLFTTFAMLSASLVPVLSLTSGIYTICKVRGDRFCLHMRFGANEEIQLEPPTGGQRQQWLVTQVGSEDFILMNSAVGCQVTRGSKDSIDVPICLDNLGSVVTVSQAPGPAEDAYFIDVPGATPPRIAHDTFVNPMNATFSETNTDSEGIYTEFRFIRVSDSI